MDPLGKGTPAKDFPFRRNTISDPLAVGRRRRRRKEHENLRGERWLRFNLYFSPQQMHHVRNNRSNNAHPQDKSCLWELKRKFQSSFQNLGQPCIFLKFFFLYTASPRHGGRFVNKIQSIHFYIFSSVGLINLLQCPSTKLNRAAAIKVKSLNFFFVFVISASLFKAPIWVVLTFNLCRCASSLCFHFCLILWLMNTHYNLACVAQRVCVCVCAER